MTDTNYYEHGFKTGYKTGVYDERHPSNARKDRIAWRKLFLIVVLAAFTAHFLWAVFAAYLV